jgi:hypothetical protein
MALQGAPYIYDVSRLRVNVYLIMTPTSAPNSLTFTKESRGQKLLLKVKVKVTL